MLGIIRKEVENRTEWKTKENATLNDSTVCLHVQYLGQFCSPISQKTCTRNGVDSKKGSKYDQGYAMTSVQGGTKLARTLYPEKRELILELYKIVSGMEKTNREEMFAVSSKKRTRGISETSKS